jgi:hypothetical protein
MLKLKSDKFKRDYMEAMREGFDTRYQLAESIG